MTSSLMLDYIKTNRRPLAYCRYIAGNLNDVIFKAAENNYRFRLCILDEGTWYRWSMDEPVAIKLMDRDLTGPQQMLTHAVIPEGVTSFKIGHLEHEIAYAKLSGKTSEFHVYDPDDDTWTKVRNGVAVSKRKRPEEEKEEHNVACFNNIDFLSLEPINEKMDNVVIFTLQGSEKGHCYDRESLKQALKHHFAFAHMSGIYTPVVKLPTPPLYITYSIINALNDTTQSVFNLEYYSLSPSTIVYMHGTTKDSPEKIYKVDGVSKKVGLPGHSDDWAREKITRFKETMAEIQRQDLERQQRQQQQQQEEEIGELSTTEEENIGELSTTDIEDIGEFSTTDEN